MNHSNNKLMDMNNSQEDVRLDYAELRKAVLVLRAINHKLRQAIINLLEDTGPMTVTDIYVKLRIEQSVASQHLAVLRRSGVVITEREGKYIHYSINKARIAVLNKLIDELVP